MSDLGVITADVPVLEGCPLLSRLKLFVTQLGVVPTIEHTVRDRQGTPLDLSSLFDDASESEGTTASDQLYVRSKELVAPASSSNTVYQAAGTVVDAAAGLVRFTLESDAVRAAGVYQLSISLHDAAGNRIYVDNPLMLVERSLFPLDLSVAQPYDQGPPTLQEIRQSLMDSGAGDNLLLDNVEFSDDQIAYAFARPVRQWNDTPPPLRPSLDTRSYPFLEPWTRAICGHLLLTAAHNYRRNHLPYSAGGMSIDDKNKETQYLRAGKDLLDEYSQFVQYKKVEINTALFTGSVHSIYGGIFH